MLYVYLFALSHHYYHQHHPYIIIIIFNVVNIKTKQ